MRKRIPRHLQHNRQLAIFGHCTCLCHLNYAALCICGAEEWLRAAPPKKQIVVKEIPGPTIFSRIRDFYKKISV